MDRTPPREVRRALTSEVGFGCPVPGCANPYLEYHHFDPPWTEREHHDRAGMIALCAEHHKKADAGAFTHEQLSAMKQSTGEQVTGRFDWLRNRLLAVVGGNFYYETLTIFEFRGKRTIWFNRDEAGRLLLNLRMLTSSGEKRLRLEDNDWIIQGDPVDFESPPSGGRRARYANGDELRIEFFDLTQPAATQRYPTVHQDRWTGIDFPITTVEVQHLIGGANLGFGPTWTKLGGVQITGSFFVRNAVGISWS